MEHEIKNTKDILQELYDINMEDLSVKTQLGLIDVEKNHNVSWAQDLFQKNKNKLDRVALFYRGTKITYKELFVQVELYADRFQSMGICKGIEVPICASYCPEFVYSIIALNLLEAKINCFGEYDPNYLTQIIDDCNAKFMICTDDKYSKIKSSIDSSNINKIVMFSLADSLKNEIDPYFDLDKDFYDFRNKVRDYQQINSQVISKSQFLIRKNENPIKKIVDYNKGNINTEFLITYTSGSTDSKKPKAMVHSNRSLITMGRFQDPDLSGLPNLSNVVGGTFIPTHSNSGIIVSLSDVLYKGATAALEPIYDKDFLLISIAINKFNYLSAPRNMIVYAMKKLYKDKNYSNYTMPNMMLFTSVGEPTSMGEEKFINKMLKKAKSGTAMLPRPFAPVPLSIGGGDCERGGIFFTPFRAYHDLLPKYKLTGSRCGLKKHGVVQTAILDEQGNKLPNGSVGLLVIKAPTVMKYYKNNPEATKKAFITDAEGQKWSNTNTYAITDKFGSTEMLERMGREIILEDNTKFPLFYIGKEIERDTKHILSYEIINVNNTPVVHLEFQPGVKNNATKIITGIENRIYKKYGREITDKLLYRIRSFDEGFPSTKSGKRSYNLLLEEGITNKCVRLVYDNGQFNLKSEQNETELDCKKMLKKI